MPGGGEKYYMQTQNLLGAVHSYNEKETIFWIVEKVKNMKPKDQDRKGESVKRKKYRNHSCKEVSFNNKK